MKKEYTFTFTIGAVRDICERCPDHDIERIGELFDEHDFVAMLDNMAWFISVLNQWSVFKETGSRDGALKVEDVLLMDMDEVNALFAQAMAAFNRDQKADTEITETKKAEAVSENNE